jgi:REP element-mobilizing transposase RayT
MPSRLIRKNIRLELENYLGERLYFVTLCCARRRELLDRPGVSSWAIARLRQSAARHAFEVHSYCVMPDHFHLLAEGIRGSSNLLRLLRITNKRQDSSFSKDGRNSYGNSNISTTSSENRTPSNLWLGTFG